jgi:hypothetical protein
MTERLALKLSLLIDGFVAKSELSGFRLKLYEAYKPYKASYALDKFSLQYVETCRRSTCVASGGDVFALNHPVFTNERIWILAMLLFDGVVALPLSNAAPCL